MGQVAACKNGIMALCLEDSHATRDEEKIPTGSLMVKSNAGIEAYHPMHPLYPALLTCWAYWVGDDARQFMNDSSMPEITRQMLKFIFDPSKESRAALFQSDEIATIAANYTKPDKSTVN